MKPNMTFIAELEAMGFKEKRFATGRLNNDGCIYVVKKLPANIKPERVFVACPCCENHTLQRYSFRQGRLVADTGKQGIFPSVRLRLFEDGLQSWLVGECKVNGCGHQWDINAINSKYDESGGLFGFSR